MTSGRILFAVMACVAMVGCANEPEPRRKSFVHGPPVANPKGAVIGGPKDQPAPEKKPEPVGIAVKGSPREQADPIAERPDSRPHEAAAEPSQEPVQPSSRTAALEAQLKTPKHRDDGAPQNDGLAYARNQMQIRVATHIEPAHEEVHTSMKGLQTTYSIPERQTDLREVDIRNTGSRTISQIKLTVYFCDRNGTALGEQAVYGVNGRGSRGAVMSDDPAPLRPGYTRSLRWEHRVPGMEERRAFRFTIDSIEFEDSPSPDAQKEDAAPRKPVHVREYTKKDGTVVREHDRSAPGTGK